MSDKYLPKKLFTRDEANRMLPLVRRITEDIRDTFLNLASKIERYRELVASNRPQLSLAESDEVENLRDELEAGQQRIGEFARELDELGVILKGEADGLVDFPAIREGRVVFLCWKLGEPEIGYWHEIEAGFAGRTPIDLFQRREVSSTSASPGH